MLRTTLYAAGLTATLLSSSAFAQGQFDNFGASSGAGTSGMYMGVTLGAALSPDYEYKDVTNGTTTKGKFDLNTGLGGALTFGWTTGDEQIKYGAEFEVASLRNATDKITIDSVEMEAGINTTALMVGGVTMMELSDALSGYIGASIGTAGTNLDFQASTGTASFSTASDIAWAFTLGGKAGLSWQVNDTTSLIGGYRLLSVGETKWDNSGTETTYERRNHHIFEMGARFHF